MIQAFKAFTHDLKSPIQGGEPVWDGKLPFTLPYVEVDRSKEACAAGWNACYEGHTALKIAGLWPNGWPVRLFRVQTSERVVERGDKVRAGGWEVVEEVSVNPHILTLSACFGDAQQEMADQQVRWHTALGRGGRSEELVVEGLKLSLRTKGLWWKLERHKGAREAWGARDARDAWGARDAWDAWDAWSAREAWDAWGARGARDARDAWSAWDAWDAWSAREAWDAWGARDARDARDAWSAWDAWSALAVYYASLRKYVTIPKLKLTTGLREAYHNGLLLALPTGKNELGYVMAA